jgi:hypothetical protein
MRFPQQFPDIRLTKLRCRSGPTGAADRVAYSREKEIFPFPVTLCHDASVIVYIWESYMKTPMAEEKGSYIIHKEVLGPKTIDKAKASDFYLE